MKINLTSKIKKKPGVVFKQSNASVYLLNPENLTMHTLNKTASEIWTMFAKTKTSITEVVNALSKKYKVDKKILARDVKQVVAHLIDNNFVSVQRGSKNRSNKT